MAKEIGCCCYECDCGHQLNFCENTIREMKAKSFRKRIGIGEGSNRHAAVFHKGEFVAVFCPKANADRPATSAIPEPPLPRTVNPRRKYTTRQAQVLAFIHLYAKLNRRPPAEADIANYFQVTPPTAHGLVVALVRDGLIDRQPGTARSIDLLIDPSELPPLG